MFSRAKNRRAKTGLVLTLFARAEPLTWFAGPLNLARETPEIF
jgi:hypothetical protein